MSRMFACDFDYTRSAVIPSSVSFNIEADTEAAAMRKLITMAINILPKPTNYTCEINIVELDTETGQQSLELA